MGNKNDPHAAERDLRGGLAGAVVVAICFGPLLLAMSARTALISCGMLVLLGGVAGSIGSSASEFVRALVLGILTFMIGSFLYLPFVFGYLWIMEWWGNDRNATTATLDTLALFVSACCLGGLCGAVGSIVGRGVPRPTAENGRLQFTIREVLCLFVLVALYLGPLVFFLRKRLS